jgi:hypothetical protein
MTRTSLSAIAAGALLLALAGPASAVCQIEGKVVRYFSAPPPAAGFVDVSSTLQLYPAVYYRFTINNDRHMQMVGDAAAGGLTIEVTANGTVTCPATGVSPRPGGLATTVDVTTLR